MRLKIRRLLAAFIDYAIILMILFIPLNFLINMWRDIITKYYIYVPLGIIVIIFFFTLIFRKDCFIKNVSIGKKIYQLEIIDENNNIVLDKDMLIKRNMVTMNILYFPLYPFMILINNKSFGDIKYKTKVEIKEKNNSLPEIITLIVFILLQVFDM